MTKLLDNGHDYLCIGLLARDREWVFGPVDNSTNVQPNRVLLTINLRFGGIFYDVI